MNTRIFLLMVTLVSPGVSSELEVEVSKISFEYEVKDKFVLDVKFLGGVVHSLVVSSLSKNLETKIPFEHLKDFSSYDFRNPHFFLSKENSFYIDIYEDKDPNSLSKKIRYVFVNSDYSHRMTVVPRENQQPIYNIEHYKVTDK